MNITMSKKTVILSGGQLKEEFVEQVLRDGEYEEILGVDKGLDFLYHHKITPTYILGDFDSVSEEALNYFMKQEDIQVRRFNPEKNATDTQIAVELALEIGSREITILGATGTRLDHVLGNLSVLGLAMEQGVSCTLLDPWNKVEMIKEKQILKKCEQYGTFVSLIPYAGEVKGITLKGFKYPLFNHTFSSFDSLGISNEIVEESAVITFNEGILIMIQSKDR